MITCIAPLSANNSLRNLNIKNNKVFTIRQIEFLSELPWLQYLEMHGNPCCCKQNFRARVIFRLSKLLKLDRTIVSAEEKVRSYNLYETDLGDLRGRTEIFQKYLPNQEFKLYTPTFFDDENNTQLDHLYDIGQKEQYSAISFIEKDVQYWCIKSPLYFSEIYDDRKSFIPISTFEEVNPDELQNHVQKDDSEKEIREPNTENDDNQSEPSNEGSELSDEGSLPSNEGSFHSNEGSEISNEDQEELREPYEEEELDGEQMTLKEDTIEDLMNKR
jgi:hypothetical protein